MVKGWSVQALDMNRGSVTCLACLPSAHSSPSCALCPALRDSATAC